jgi:L-2-hydroxyglutarate oxidase LhgO
MEKVDAVVIGAGVLGLAVGRALARRGLETVVLERAHAIGTATSSRNSEVVHAGLYYPTDSLKARLCVQGRRQLYAYCESHGVAHKRCGKLLVATEEDQVAGLARIDAQARANGVDDLQWLDSGQVRHLEPELRAVSALFSPSTGIVDSHGLMLSLQGDLEASGGALVLRSPVQGARCGAAGHVLQVGEEAGMELATPRVVNAAGLWAPALAQRVQGLSAIHVPEARFAKGSYFAVTGRVPFSHLVYPVPQEAGLGVHLTLDLAGQARFGPDVEWITPETPDHIDYRVDAGRARLFEAEVRRYWPALPEGALQPAYSGVRPKLHAPGRPAHDFMLQGPMVHGVPGWVNLFGIESPGLTACLAMADEVVRLLEA